MYETTFQNYNLEKLYSLLVSHFMVEDFIKFLLGFKGLLLPWKIMAMTNFLPHFKILYFSLKPGCDSYSEIFQLTL